jgi:hypothetical protein
MKGAGNLLSGASHGEDREAIRYLLGELSSSARATFEERYFADDAHFEELRAVEDELIGAYLRGELGFFTRRRFRRQYLADVRRRQRVEFVARLIETARPLLLDPPPLRATFWWGGWMAAVAAGLVAVSVLTWGISRERRASAEVAELRAAREEVFAITADTGLVRGTERPVRWRVPPTAAKVKLRLKLPASAPNAAYRARVVTPEGVAVWEVPGLRAGAAGVVEVSLPAKVIPAGDYIVRLETETGPGATEPVEDYSFSVSK